MKTAPSNDPLVAFLYLLMRDRLTPGAVESLVEDVTKTVDHSHPPHRYVFTNGYLAAHAEDIAARLRPPRPTRPRQNRRRAGK